MDSVIEDIMNADTRLEKRAKRFVKDSKALDKVIVYDDQLTAILQKGSKKSKLFEKFKDNLDEYHANESVEYYKAGFRLGFRIALEVMDEE